MHAFKQLLPPNIFTSVSLDCVFFFCFVIGLTMSLKETRGNLNFFVFEHNHQYQQVQFKFYDAVESLNPQNIMVKYVLKMSAKIFSTCILSIDFHQYY